MKCLTHLLSGCGCLHGALCTVCTRGLEVVGSCIPYRAQGEGDMEPEAVGGSPTKGTVSVGRWVTVSEYSLVGCERGVWLKCVSVRSVCG